MASGRTVHPASDASVSAVGEFVGREKANGAGIEPAPLAFRSIWSRLQRARHITHEAFGDVLGVAAALVTVALIQRELDPGAWTEQSLPCPLPSLHPVTHISGRCERQGEPQ
jgi:hypothetical protein